jgi:RHS repeat-associated protein
VVEPNPNGDGTVATGGLVTAYAYSTLGNLVQINQGAQVRLFKYDALGRLNAQKLGEPSATLNDVGVYVGNGSWTDVFTYDDRSNLTSRTDARGVKTVYDYGNDPLNRLQSVSWDTSGFGDTDNPILPAATVSYQYRQKANGAELKDITQLESVSTAGVSSESYGYDSEGRVSSKSLTLTSRPDYAFATNYSYDNLDRVTDVLYPAQYLNGTQPRKQVHHDYDIASRLSGLTYDGQSFASNIIYNAASQTTSLNIGAGANQIVESYGYSALTGLLDNQTVVRGGTTTLLNLSYDYLRAGTTSGRTGQLTRVLNNLNHNRDRGYSYDALGRLVQATGGPSTAPLWTQTYAYDRYGNRTSVNASGYSAKNRGRDAGSAGVSPALSAQRVVTEPGAIATGSNVQPSTPPLNLLARNEIAPLWGTSPTVKEGSEPLSDSPPTLHSSPPQSGPPTFTDDPLNDPNNPESFKIKALHITELRTRINELRVQRGLLNYSWQQPTATQGVVATGGLITADPIIEMRTALDQALGPPSGGYSAGLAQGQPVLAIHIQELRDRVKNNWNSSVPIPRDGHASLSYDTASNRITTAGFLYDAAGNQTQVARIDGSVEKFQYDAANRLRIVRDGNNTQLASYTYGDSNERLIAEEGSTRTYYVGEGGATTAEYAETGGSVNPAWSKTYVYLGNRLLSTLTPNGSGGEALEYHHPDRLGTRLVTNPSTGSWSEQVTLPFGTALGAESSGTPTNRRFTSYDRSATTKLDYAGNRHYDPQQGRFTQVDPAGMSATSLANPQSLNLFAYCTNDPVNHVDPSGLGFFSAIKKFFKKFWKILVVVAVVAAVVILTTGAGSALLGVLKSAANAIWSGIKAAANAIWSGLKSVAHSLQSLFTNEKFPLLAHLQDPLPAAPEGYTWITVNGMQVLALAEGAPIIVASVTTISSTALLVAGAAAGVAGYVSTVGSAVSGALGAQVSPTPASGGQQPSTRLNASTDSCGYYSQGGRPDLAAICRKFRHGDWANKMRGCLLNHFYAPNRGRGGYLGPSGSNPTTLFGVIEILVGPETHANCLEQSLKK